MGAWGVDGEQEWQMKVMINAKRLDLTGRLGPICIACGNTRTFLIHTPEGDLCIELSALPDGEVRVAACGRCRSRNSIVITRVD
jgi:hypothetical protein